MFYDGTTTSKTALMLHPYKDGTYGERIQKQEDFIALVKKARALDLAVAVHVIGDLGLEEVLNILKTYPVKNGLKDRIIHASYASKKAIELLKTIPCFIDYQPQFVTTDFPETLDVFSKDPDYIFPLKTYHDKKIAYGLSSDAPVEIPNPLVGMYAATLRKNEKGQYQSHERITLKEAFLGYTKHAWSLTPYKAGEIKEGFHAHFIVLDADLFSIDLEKLKTLSVKQTWIDGKKVFENT
jgi:predicted amidohydrolase YtcJ